VRTCAVDIRLDTTNRGVDAFLGTRQRCEKTVLKKKTKKMFQNVIKTFVMAPDALPLL